MTRDKKSVLFVDDESMLLQGLRRNFRSLSGSWDAAFADSGAAALELLEQRRFDVVVSDMMMPFMNGAQLLDAIRERHPRTARIILSGHADPELIRHCTSCAHQFISKPCTFEMLTAALDRATSFTLSAQSEALAGLVARIERLPSPHDVCIELDRLMLSASLTADEVGAVVGRDVSMAAQVLKLVNSAFFGLAHRVESPQEAVTYLGVETIRTIALCFSINDEMARMGLAGSVISRLWDHSLAVSAGARRIAGLERADDAVVVQATTAGLLHDIGQLILALNFRDLHREATALAQAEQLPLFLAERKVFGCTHAEVAAYLFALWGLPQGVLDAVAWHHHPRGEGVRRFSGALAVHAADALLHESRESVAGPAAPPIDLAYLGDLHLAGRLPAWREAIRLEPPRVR
jgi:putative nucleotidyltransferase with HDIG domain